MDFGMEVGIFLAYAVGLMAVYFLGRLLIVPIKTLLKLVLNSIIGGVILMVINFFGGSLGIFLPVNFLTAVIAGLLGIPGVLGMALYFYLTALF